MRIGLPRAWRDAARVHKRCGARTRERAGHERDLVQSSAMNRLFCRAPRLRGASFLRVQPWPSRLPSRGARPSSDRSPCAWRLHRSAAFLIGGALGIAGSMVLDRRAARPRARRAGSGSRCAVAPPQESSLSWRSPRKAGAAHVPSHARRSYSDYRSTARRKVEEHRSAEPPVQTDRPQTDPGLWDDANMRQPKSGAIPGMTSGST